MQSRESHEPGLANVVVSTEEAKQSDDATMSSPEVDDLSEPTVVLEVPASVSELNHVLGFLHEELSRRQCPQREQNRIDLAVEELFVNVCNYAYPEATEDEPGTVRIQRTDNDDLFEITISLIDAGIPFNPLEKPDAELPDNIEDVPIGGLGIFMAKQLVDEIRYEWNDGKNKLTIVKRWEV